MTANKVVLLLLSGLVAAGSAVASSAAKLTVNQFVVMTERGPIKGTVTPTLRKFLGIPYAAPPVADLRWRPPQAHARWLTPIDATKFRNHCPQDASILGTASATEDCLFLNVFTPNDESPGEDDVPSPRHPVMVWIHGGGLIVGESDDYRPTKLVEKGDVIVVTINYRLGAFGFLAHPALSAESAHHASGNYGIMDQQFALQWVRRNIAAFGGDPHNVTIFGESAGGQSVFSNMASPPAAKLFERAIVESGAYQLTLPTLADAESQGTAFATSVGCSDQTVECLRAISVETVLANQPGLFETSPNVDGNVLPQSLDTAFATGQFNHVPLMQGTNHDEWRFFVALLFDLSDGPITAEAYPSVVEGMVGPDAAPLVLAQYPLSDYASPDLAVGALGTDSIFACTARAADQMLSTQVPTFAYEFNDTNAPEILLPPVSFPYGGTHASELLYLFKLTWPGQFDTQQHKLSNKMVRYWTQFARSADPNSQDMPLWPLYDPAVDEFQSLVPPSPMGEFEFATAHQCNFWAKLFGAASGRVLTPRNKRPWGRRISSNPNPH